MILRPRLAGLILVSAGALVLGVIEPAVGAPATHTQHRIPPGTAAATASVLGITPGVSGLQLTTAIGESSAAYQRSETQAKSATVDLGSLGLVLATSQLCGRSDLPMSAQPKALTADSEHGPHHLTHGGGGIGTEDVSVVRSPQSASATTTTVNQSIPGVLTVRGQSRATVRYIADREQVAQSSVTETVSLLGGRIQLDGMNWTATRRSGVVTSRSTHFSFGQVTIAGKRMAGPDAAQSSTITLINKALAPLGLSIVRPAISTNNQTGAVALGPLILRFSGSSLDRKVLGPVVGSVIALENLIKQAGRPGSNCADFRQLIENVGDNLDTLLNVGLAVSEGAGALDVQFGGVAAAALDQPDFANPFGDGTLPPSVAGSATSTGTPTTAHAAPPPGSASTSTAGGSTGTPPALASDASHCVSLSPSHAHGCWKGIATVASAGALGLGVALFLAEFVLARRRRIAHAMSSQPGSANASE
jgi:hypothetical protein